MVQWGITELERPQSAARESNRRQATDAATPDAEEIERVVDVAEWLGISPAVAAAALRRGDGEVRTDVRLEASIRSVERRLRRET